MELQTPIDLMNFHTTTGPAVAGALLIAATGCASGKPDSYLHRDGRRYPNRLL